MYLPEPIQSVVLQQDVIQIVRNDMAESLTLTFVHIHSISHELIKRLDRVTDGLDLVIDQLLFRFLFHKSLLNARDSEDDETKQDGQDECGDECGHIREG